MEPLVLTAPNSFTLKLVQERFLPEISRQARLAYHQVPPFEFRILDSAATNNVHEAASLRRKRLPQLKTSPKSKPLSGVTEN